MTSKLDLLTKPRRSAVSEFDQAHARLRPLIPVLADSTELTTAASRLCVPLGEATCHVVADTTISNLRGRQLIVSGVCALQIEISCLPQR